MEGTYKKSKGNAGLDGVQFQLDLLTVFALNALRSRKDWKISTENEQAGKYDDLVLELPDKNVFLQAKFKQSKKITRDQLFSSNSKNADFSLAKYFFSYLDIRTAVKATTVIICTNTDVNQKDLKDVLTTHRVTPDSLLHYDGATCPYFTLNENILPDLKENAETYLDKNLQGKGFDKAEITDENIKDFLKNFQFFYNYPNGKELHEVIERLLCRLGDMWSRTTYHEIYRKVEEWFKQPRGEYLTASRAKAMLCEIRSDQYCNSLKNYNISFERNDINFSNSDRIIHIKTKGGCLLQMLRIFQALQGDKAKQLYVNPDEDIEMNKCMVEAFGLPRYVFLIMVWPKIRNRTVKMDIISKVREILEKHQYKKMVLLTESVVEIDQEIGLTDVSKVNGSVTFQDFSENSQVRLLKSMNIVFQGERVSLEELLDVGTAEDYTKSLDCRMLEKLVEGENIKIGERVLGLDEDLARYYVHRTFERETDGKEKTKDPIPEENLFEVAENVVLISDSAGMGKSTALIKMATHVKQINSRKWVIKINLIDYTKILRDSLRQKKETITIEELMNSQEATKFKNQFEEFIFSINEKVVLILDGIDEIAPHYTNLIVHLIQQSQKAKNIVKVFASTRPHMTAELKADLNVGPFKMLPFTRQDQKKFLIDYWTHHLQLEDSYEMSKCAQYVEMLIEKMSSWTGSYLDENSIVAIPLQVRMIADIFQEENIWESENWESCREFLNGSKENPKLPEKFNITKLYDMFIAKKRDVFIDKANPSGNTAADEALMNQFEECLAHHGSLALRAILSESHRNLFSSYQERDSSCVLKIGIVQQNDGYIFFIHRTFAEYFVAASVLRELQLSPNLEFQTFLIDEIFRNNEFDVIRVFLDNALKKVIDSLPANIFAEYQSHARDIYFGLIFSLADDGCAAILQLIFKSINFRIVKGKIIDVEDCDAGEGIMNTLNYLHVITQEAGVNIRNEDGQAPLYLAAESCHSEMAKFLIDHGAEIDILDKKNRTPLIASAGMEDFSIVQCLVEHGANVNAIDDDGITALDWAAEEEQLDVIRYLAKCGANINRRNDRGRSNLDWGAETNRLNIVECLVECGANVNDRCGEGRTALHRAAEKGAFDTTVYLAEHGANVNEADGNGHTAAQLARQNNNFDIVNYLEALNVDVDDVDNNKSLLI